MVGGVCYPTIITITTILSCLLLIGPANLTRNNKDCPDICSCLGYYVDCAAKNLENVPSNIPKWATHLDLHNNAIKKLNDPVWRNLTDLTVLKLSKNDISIIPNEAFVHQKGLKILELNQNRLTYIDALTFKKLEHLTTLKLKRNQISQLQDGAFYGLLAINKLILDYNQIQVISKVWLYGLDSLRELSLSHNSISSIQQDTWEFCIGLTVLDLSYNKLESIQADTFKALVNLEKLVLNNNKITIIEEDAFRHVSNLRILHLSNNKISLTIEDANGVFQGLINLNKFHLAGNNIKSINKNALVGLRNVTYLNLNFNNITSIQKNAFDKVPLLSDLIMNTTSLLCDCNLRWFYDWLATKKFNVVTVCAYPERLRGQSLLDVPINNFTCDALPKPRLINEPEPEMMALKGENISLSCTAMSNSNSAMSFQWKKDNIVLPNKNVEVKSSTDGKSTETIISKLNIFNVQHTDAGKYQCIVSNDFGTTYSQKSNISVLIFPVFTKTPANITVQPGANAQLECAVYGEPQPEIGWQKDGGNDFPAARERRIDVMATDNVFLIKNVKSSDMGIYSCTAHNAAGTVVANASLIVQVRPSFVKSMENKEVTAGESIVIQCMASGIPKPAIRWSKDNLPIKTTERHFFTAEDQLMIIVDTVQTDSGMYECHLNNSLGEETGYSYLKVNPGYVLGNFTTTDMMGIIIISVVICAVATSIIWVVIIYQTRKRLAPPGANNPTLQGPVLEFANKSIIHLTDNASDRSSCKDSGTGDSAKRSNDDLAFEEFGVIIHERPVPQPSWRMMRTASLVYINSDSNNSSHTPLLHSDVPYARSTNHDRASENSGEGDEILTNDNEDNAHSSPPPPQQLEQKEQLEPQDGPPLQPPNPEQK